MARKKVSNVSKSDFDVEENIDICGFTTEPVINGDCISSFSFDDDNHLENATKALTAVEANTDIIKDHAIIPEVKNTAINTTLADNRKTSIVNGCAPPIDGEYLEVKRTYMLRSSTVRKLNELKSIHPDLNTYVSSIVDIAIAHYYNHIINQGGTQ